MGDMGAVLEPIEGSEVEQVETQEVEQPEAETQQVEDPYSSKSAREFSETRKRLSEAHPEDAKFFRTTKDVFSQNYALKQLEPRGVDGVREKYAMLDSVMHGDLKGTEAVSALQDELRTVQETDSLLAAGDPRALEALGEDFNEGLAKLTPSILDRIKQSDPEAYANAILPHLYQNLMGSELVSAYNGIVDALSEQPPKWLTPNQLTDWRNDNLQKVHAAASTMNSWFKAQGDKVKGLQTSQTPPRGTNGRFQGKSEPTAESRAEQVLQEHHWNTQINPKMDQHAAQSFQKLFAPYASRLKLDQGTTNALRMEFSKRVASLASKDPAYMAQIKRYWSQNKPDPSTVVNFTKVQFDKHASTALKSLVDERYKPFLNGGKPKPQVQSNNGQKVAAVSPGVKIVTVKPPADKINIKATPLDWIHQKKYKLYDGSIVQVRQ